MMENLHVPEQCLGDSQRSVLLAELVDLLIAQRSEVCPACLLSTLRELAEEGSKLWREQIWADDGPHYRH